MKIKPQYSGFVLITVLLFVMVLTIVIMNVAEGCLLESRMSNYYAQEAIAFYAAERKLLKEESEIMQGKNSTKFPHFNICANDNSAVIYVVEVNANYHDAVALLRSIVAKVERDSSCAAAAKLKPGRQSWVTISS